MRTRDVGGVGCRGAALGAVGSVSLCPVFLSTAVLRDSLPRGTTAFTARRRPTPNRRCPETVPRRGRAVLRGPGPARGAPARPHGGQAQLGAGAAVQENRAALPRAAATPQKGSAARGSARRSARGATPPFGAPTPTALAPGPAPQAADGSGSSRGDTCSVQRRRNGSRSGAAPQPGKSACRVRSAMSDAAPSPSLERINVSELQSVVTNNNNNKLPCCCSIAQTNDRREPRGAFPRLAAAPPRGPARPQRAAGGDGPPRPMGLGPQRVGASLWPRGGTLLSRQPRGTGDRSATRPEQC